MAEPERVWDIIYNRITLGTPGRSKRLEILRSNWRSLAGERVAEHSRPTKLSRGTLTVSADGASWAGELSAASYQLIKDIEKMLGEGAVRKIRVLARAGQWGQERSGDVDIEEPGEVCVQGERGTPLGDFDDDEVREALGRMVRASRSSKQNKQGRR